MLKRFAFIYVLLLFANVLHAQKNVYQAIVEHQVIKMPGVNRTELVEYAKSYLGTAYCYGSIDPAKGFDCSGFVSYVFNHFNIKLPHISQEYEFLGEEKKPDDFEVGDILVFYGYKDRNRVGHVGIICEADGMNSKFIHASSGKVKEVTISELSSPHYTERFFKCIDVIR